MKLLVARSVVLPVRAIGCDGDDDRAFRSFVEEGAFGFQLIPLRVGVDELHLALSENFEAVVEVSSGCQRLGSKAGAGVIDFDEFD